MPTISPSAMTRTTTPMTTAWVRLIFPATGSPTPPPGGHVTMSRVAMGPSRSDTSHQLDPDRCLDCARPALMSDSVNQAAENVTYWSCTAPL